MHSSLEAAEWISRYPFASTYRNHKEQLMLWCSFSSKSQMNSQKLNLCWMRWRKWHWKEQRRLFCTFCRSAQAAAGNAAGMWMIFISTSRSIGRNVIVTTTFGPVSSLALITGWLHLQGKGWSSSTRSWQSSYVCLPSQQCQNQNWFSFFLPEQLYLTKFLLRVPLHANVWD